MKWFTYCNQEIAENLDVLDKKLNKIIKICNSSVKQNKKALPHLPRTRSNQSK